MSDEDHLFQKLILEAIQACGDDVSAIEGHVFNRLGAMNVEQRERIQRDIQRVLGFREPPGPPYQVN